MGLDLEFKDKSRWIQAFRAWAIIAVVVIHTTPEGWQQIVIQPWANFSVATFLFLSGYLTKLHPTDWSSFCKRRILRVAFPYLIWATAYSLPYIYKDGLEVIIPGLLKAAWCAPLYYLLVYVQLVLLTPCLARLAQSRHWHLGLWITPIALLLFKYDVFFGITLDNALTWLWPDLCYFFFAWLSFYYLGLLLGNQRLVLKLPQWQTIFIAYCLAVGLQIAEGEFWNFWGVGSNAGTQLKLSSLLSSGVFAIMIHSILQSNRPYTIPKFWTTLGNYSFGIYLTHILVITILKKTPIYDYLPYPINSAVVVVISCLGCHLGYKILGSRISAWLGLR